MCLSVFCVFETCEILSVFAAAEEHAAVERQGSAVGAAARQLAARCPDVCCKTTENGFETVVCVGNV